MAKCSRCKFYTEKIEEGIMGQCDILEGMQNKSISSNTYNRIEDYWLGKEKGCPLFEEK